MKRKWFEKFLAAFIAVTCVTGLAACGSAETANSTNMAQSDAVQTEASQTAADTVDSGELNLYGYEDAGNERP